MGMFLNIIIIIILKKDNKSGIRKTAIDKKENNPLYLAPFFALII